MKNQASKPANAAKKTKWTNVLKRAARALFAALVNSFERRSKPLSTVRRVEFSANGTAKYQSDSYDYSATISQVKARKVAKE